MLGYKDLQLAAVLFAAALSIGCRSERSERPTVEAFGQRWQVLGGVWEPKDGGLVGRAGVVQTDGSFRDGVIDVDVELLSGPADHDLGVAFRYSATNGDTAKGNGYGFNFTFSKAFRLVRGQEGQYITLVPSPPVVPGLADRVNHVRVAMKGSAFEISVNNQPSVQFQDATFPLGAISFWVDSQSQRVRFSNFRFTQL